MGIIPIGVTLLYHTSLHALSMERDAFSQTAIELDFDDLPSETVVDDYYLDKGVFFENAWVLCHIYAVSLPNVIQSINWDEPITIRFPEGVDRVGIQIDTDGYNPDRQPQMRAFDAYGLLLGIENFVQGPDFVGLEFPGIGIYTVQLGGFRWVSPSAFVGMDGYDNLIFEGIEMIDEDVDSDNNH
jgi:hypothetical protein